VVSFGRLVKDDQIPEPGCDEDSVPKKSRSELKSEATRQALLDAAREVFARKGLDLATIEDITELADVGKGTFYYYFQDKNEIVLELLDSVMRDLSERIDERCRDVETLEPLLDNLIAAHLEFFSTRPADLVLYFQGRADLTLKEGYEGLDEPILKHLNHVATLIDEVIQYHLSESTLTRIACAVAGFVSGYFSFAAIAYEERELEKTLKPVRKALVVGLSRFIKEAIPRDA